jgi:hypothetical protein
MATSIFLARLIGPVCLVIGIALLINGAAFRTLAGEFLNNPALMFLSGVITLPAGLAVVLTHNVWTADWRILITLLGWLAIVGGLARILAPQRAVAVGRTLLANPSTLHISTGVYLLIGALLCFFGYIH